MMEEITLYGRILFFTEEVILHGRGYSSRKRSFFTEEVTLHGRGYSSRKRSLFTEEVTLPI